MPKVLDNIDLRLIDSLREMLEVSHAADFCVGYFHLRGWKKVGDLVGNFEGGDGKQARLLVGMTPAPEREMQLGLAIVPPAKVDAGEARRRETALVQAFHKQLTFGLPDNASEAALRRLARQLREKKVCVKLFLRYPLHAKLYLTYSDHPGAPIVGFVGSSNLTGPGLSDQGELNVDVTDGDATKKLHDWFEARWNDLLARDVSELLAEIIEESWAREKPASPYLVYLKIAYHLAQDALEAPKEYRLPPQFEEIVLPFQREAILRTRRMLRVDPQFPNRNQIALLGDVVGMGKTLTATAIAKLFQDEEGGRVIVCCPPKLKPMWEHYLRTYELAGEVIPYSKSATLKNVTGRTRLMVLDESHNLRNRQTIAWGNLRDYIRDQDARVLLLSATPYNKHYDDLAGQLRLGIDEQADLGIRPEEYFRTMNEELFVARFQALPRSLTAFEQSTSADDWRDLLRHMMVRRTRGWIIKHYADFDEERKRHYITLAGGIRSYFPLRVPRTLRFDIAENDPNDQYARLFNQTVVDTIGDLCLPRYGLGLYTRANAAANAKAPDKELLENLNTAGKRLLAYCRTNLFKRLESSGHAFLLSLRRHILRNLVFVAAIDAKGSFPIGAQDASALDTATSDVDPEEQGPVLDLDEEEDEGEGAGVTTATEAVAETMEALQKRANAIYEGYVNEAKNGKKKFKWLSSEYFRPELKDDLLADANRLLAILHSAGEWKPEADRKLDALSDLLSKKELDRKIVVFSQFADTANYLGEQLQKRGLSGVDVVTAATSNPVNLVQRFSPNSNHYQLAPGEKPLRVLIATEVLSEGQNLQDASVVVNYDLPWAIIRLIQRAGRVDRIGQDNAEVRIYSCLPADGVENLIQLRGRLVQRLTQNLEVIGTDERFFEEDADGAKQLTDLYTEKDHIYDDDEDSDDVDLSTLALGIWNEAIAADPTLEAQVKALPDLIGACRAEPTDHGVLVYAKTPDGYDSLLYVDTHGVLKTQSQIAVLRRAACESETPAQPLHPKHHDLVRSGLVASLAERDLGDVLSAMGPKHGARRRIYDRLAGYRHDLRAQHNLLAQIDLKPLEAVIDGLTKHPLTERAREVLNRKLREGVSDAALATLVLDLAEDARLFLERQPGEEAGTAEPHLICSIGLFPPPP